MYVFIRVAGRASTGYYHHRGLVLEVGFLFYRRRSLNELSESCWFLCWFSIRIIYLEDLMKLCINIKHFLGLATLLSLCFSQSCLLFSFPCGLWQIDWIRRYPCALPLVTLSILYFDFEPPLAILAAALIVFHPPAQLFCSCSLNLDKCQEKACVPVSKWYRNLYYHHSHVGGFLLTGTHDFICHLVAHPSVDAPVDNTIYLGAGQHIPNPFDSLTFFFYDN